MTNRAKSPEPERTSLFGGGRRLPLALLSATVVVSTFVLAWHAWNSVDTYLRVVQRAERDFETHDLRAEILHLDQALTDATLLAIATGDPQWEQQYRALEPKLQDAIQRAIALCPSSTALSDDVADMRDANQELVAIEHRALDLAREGREADANALLAGEPYQTEKRKYAAGLGEMLAHMRGAAHARSLALRRRAVWMLLSIAVPFPLLVLAWVFCVRSIRRHVSGHERIERDLLNARNGLESRVAEAAETLRASNVKLEALAQEHQSLLDHTRDFLYRHDTAGKFNFLSRSVEPLTGYTVEEWYTHYTTYMTDHPVNEKVVEYTEETLRTGKEHEPYLVEIRHKSGRTIMLEVNERPYFEEGHVAGIIGVARDVTERVRAAEAMEKAKEAAESASRAKSVFLANLSHEIRTPIMAMLGAAELSTGSAPHAVDGLDHRDVILRNGRHLLALVDGLLDVARLEAGKLSITPVDCSLLEILTDVRAVVLPLHHNENVEFRLICETAIPERIHTDPTRLKQAVINLVENAFKHVERGHVYLRVRVARDQSPKPRLTIAVEDTGPGIPPHAREQIFEAFAQLEPDGGGMARGVGLGLPLARAIAEKLGGSLDLETGTGEGCTFTLHVPTGPLDEVPWIDVTEEQFGPRPKGRDTTTPVGRLHGRVLVAEDFADTRNLLLTALTRAGAEVVAVTTGRETLDAAAEGSFDLMILDIRMPEMDGQAAAAELRRRGCCIALIALTASADPADDTALLQAGFDDIWRKPLSMDALVSRAAAYLATDPHRDAQGGSSGLQGGPSDDARIQQAVAEFARSLPDRVDDVRSAVQQGDLDRARAVLHQLVGAAGIHGFMDLSHRAAEVLSKARAGILGPESDDLSSLVTAAEMLARGH